MSRSKNFLTSKYVINIINRRYFWTGASGVQSKSQISFICGGVGQTSSPVKGHPPQPPPGSYSGYPYFGCSTYFFSEISSSNPFTTTWSQWGLVWAPRLIWPQTKSGPETLLALNFWTLLAARHFRPWTSPAGNLKTSPALRHFQPWKRPALRQVRTSPALRYVRP